MIITVNTKEQLEIKRFKKRNSLMRTNNCFKDSNKQKSILRMCAEN